MNQKFAIERLRSAPQPPPGRYRTKQHYLCSDIPGARHLPDFPSQRVGISPSAALERFKLEAPASISNFHLAERFEGDVLHVLGKRYVVDGLGNVLAVR